MNSVKSNGASSTLFQHERPNNPNRSKFDLSRITNFSIDTGMIVPFDCFPTLPNDIVNLDVEMALDTLPLVQSSLTNYKIVVHWYYMKSRDLWKGFKTFITKGRTGNVELTIPKVDLDEPLNRLNPQPFYCMASDKDKYLQGYYYPQGQHSLASFLGVPPSMSGLYNVVGNGAGKFVANLKKAYLPYTFKPTGEGNSGVYVKQAYEKALETGFGDYNLVNALPFMMYQAIVKNNYVNQNLLQNNKALFPEQGDDDWLLPYTIPDNICNYVSGKRTLDKSDIVNYDGIYSGGDKEVAETEVDLRMLRYAMFDDDYFTTGLPWLERGTVNGLEFSVADVNKPFEFESVLSATDEIFKSDIWAFNKIDNVSYDVPLTAGEMLERNYFRPIGEIKAPDYNEDHPDPYYDDKHWRAYSRTKLNDLISKLKVNTSFSKFGTLKSSITANALRSLLAMSVWQERNARVDGSYNRMIFQHWASNPHSEEHKPIYIGGTASYMNFSTVLQQSQTTDDSALGSTAGFGNSSGRSNIGSFKCDDYGYIMGVMIIKPNTTYQQGVERFLSCENVFDDFIQPEFESLSPQPILNKEIFASGNQTKDDDLFCYQERNTSYKVRQNVNKGLFQCKPDKDILFGAFTQARWFDSLPKFSYQFLCMSPANIRRDWLAYPVYPAFRCQILTKAFVVRSLSYSSQPNTFGF